MYEVRKYLCTYFRTCSVLLTSRTLGTNILYVKAVDSAKTLLVLSERHDVLSTTLVRPIDGCVVTLEDVIWIQIL